MPMKILYVSNSVKTYSLAYRNELPILTGLGHTLVWAANFDGFLGEREREIPFKTYHIDIVSSPLRRTNLRALRQIRDIIKKERIDALICTTPIGGMLGRLAAKKMHLAPVIYFAHGFLFFKGAPLINRTVYRLQEAWMAHMTDHIITITDEDFAAAKKFRLRRGGGVSLVHGAGVNLGVTVDVSREDKRRELSLPEDAFVLCSGGFLNKNKNNAVVIRAMARLPELPLHYLVCGEGEERDALGALAERLGLAERVHFLGYRTDMSELIAASDLFMMPSFREGIPRSLLEAMDLGLPAVGSDTRGIRELIGKGGEGGALCDPYSPDAFAEGIRRIYDMSAEERTALGARNREAARPYSSERVIAELTEIYKEQLPL